MANNRSKRKWGMDAREGEGEDSVFILTPAIQAKRDLYARDYLAFYRDILAQDITERGTKRKRADCLGTIHKLLIDFLNLDLLDEVVFYTELAKHLPEKDSDGEWKERWLYWRTLDAVPEVQDGPDGPIGKMFREKFWHGVVVRLKGDGRIKCLLIPRGHLKSTLATQGHTQWKICRAPADRHMIRSLTGGLARSFTGDIKYHFEQNEKFRRLYADLGPPAKRECAWNADFIQVAASTRRGKEPTLYAAGMESEVTGGHYDDITLDDCSGESNTKTPGLRADACLRVQRMHAILDPGCSMVDVGTRWEDDDPHSMFVDTRRSEIAHDSCFMVATVLDSDPSVKVGQRISPLGYGKPIWPEKYTVRALEKIRRGITDDRVWFGQYFNQFSGTALRTFSRDWIRRYTGTPLDAVANHKLNITVWIDTASGKDEQSGKLDYTAAVVLGQTQDRQQYYVLDGFKEKLGASQIAAAIADLAQKWHQIAQKANATFRCAVEETAYTQFLGSVLELTLRDRGVDKYIAIERIAHSAKAGSKADRIRTLAQPYSEQRVLWPEHLTVRPHTAGEPYDLMTELEDEFCRWPGVQHDDLIDAHAGAYELTVPRDFKRNDRPIEVLGKDRSAYVREEVLLQDRSLSGYDKESKWELAL